MSMTERPLTRISERIETREEEVRAIERQGVVSLADWRAERAFLRQLVGEVSRIDLEQAYSNAVARGGYGCDRAVRLRRQLIALDGDTAA